MSRTNLFLSFCLAALLSVGCGSTKVVADPNASPLWGDAANERPTCVHGIHLTSYFVGSKKGREHFEKLLETTEINTVVIDVKETEGDIFIPGVELDGHQNYVAAMPDIQSYLKFLKDRGVYTIARIAVFHDNRVARHKPEWAIHSAKPLAKAKEKGYRSDVWVDHKGSGWADPTNKLVWDYNISIAKRAAEIGFQGIQFDYIRFPSDGPTNLCIYSVPHKRAVSYKFLADFLERAHQKLKPLGVELSIDVFGLTGSADDDMGIGQKLDKLIPHVDVISPMMYPSHYGAGEYGIKNPNASPYQTVWRSIRDTKKVLKGTSVQLRPYLQDFSLGGIHYGARQVRDQIEAAQDQGVGEWILWNPTCHYTPSALLPSHASADLVGQPFTLGTTTQASIEGKRAHQRQSD